MGEMEYAHLQLGLTRKEFQRRVQNKEIDLKILSSQLAAYSQEIQLEAQSEKRLILNALDQVDKFETSE